MGRYWATRRAGSNGPAAANTPVPLVISDVVGNYAALEGVAHPTWVATRDSLTGWYVTAYVDGSVWYAEIVAGTDRTNNVDFTGADIDVPWVIGVKPLDGEDNETEVLSPDFSPGA